MRQLIKLFFFIKGLYNAKRSKRLSASAISNRQQKLYIKLVNNVLVKSKYYSNYCNASFEDIPIIDKQTHMREFNKINTAEIDCSEALDLAIRSESSRAFSSKYQNYSVGLSSGTSGSRGLFVLSEQEQAEWAGYIWGKMMPLNLKRQRIAFFLRANNNLYQSIDSLMVSFNYFDLLQSIEDHIQRLNELNPTILIAPAQVLSLLARAKNITLFIQPTKVISIAEVLEKGESEKISRSFGCTVDEIYQCTEGFLGVTCVQGNLHLNEDQLIIEKEWIDIKTRRFNPIITDLKRSTQPIVRYRLDDILIEAEQACDCGLNTTTIKKIEGRCDDVLMLRGEHSSLIRVFPDFIRNKIISAAPMLHEYQVVQKSENRIDVYIDPFDEEVINNIKIELENLFSELGLFEIELLFKIFGKSSLSDKRRRVIGIGRV